jgi:hypothetical protein
VLLTDHRAPFLTTLRVDKALYGPHAPTRMRVSSLHSVCVQEDDKLSYTFRVHFVQKEWPIQKHGQVYKDNVWLRDFVATVNNRLRAMKSFLPPLMEQDVCFSRRELQGKNYISLDLKRNAMRHFPLMFKSS